MNKIICDVCGTMYPESAAQCPICGCAKQAEVETPTADMIPEETETGSYTPVKGGRFSKANVRKRNKNVEQPVAEEVTVGEAEEAPIVAPVKEKNDDKAIRGLTITAIILALAIVAVVAFIVIRFFLPADMGKKPAEQKIPAATTATASATTLPAETTEPTELIVPCTQIQLSDASVNLTQGGQVWLLNAVALPENTTDVMSYSVADPTVASVSGEGRVTAMGPGETVITITCGQAKAEVNVLCIFPPEESLAPEDVNENGEVTEATTDVPQETLDPNANYTVYFYGEWREDNDVTMTIGQSVEVTLEDDNGNEANVKWQTNQSDVVSIDGNMFTAKDVGIAYITTTIGSTEYMVILRVY